MQWGSDKQAEKDYLSGRWKTGIKNEVLLKGGLLIAFACP